MLAPSLELVLLLLMPLPAPAPTPASATLQDRIAEIIAARLTLPGPGAVVAVVHEGQPVVVHSAGVANLDENVPLSPDSLFYLGSLAKQFTATSIALLAHEDRLTLEDPVGRYVEGLPPIVAAVPLGQLLHHRSGIRDYLKIRDLNGERDTPWDNQDALTIIRRQRSLVFATGDRYQYSNSNYILLAEVVRTVSGQPLDEFAASRVFGALSMDATFFETDATAVVPHRVISYERDRQGAWHRQPKLFDAIGDGGAYSSVRDLLEWDRALRTRTGLPRTVFDVLLTAPHGTTYGGGLLIRPFLGQNAIEHGGFMLGFQHHYLRFPDHDLAILLLTNSEEIDSFALREEIVRAAFESLTRVTLPDEATPRPAESPASPSADLPPLDPVIGGSFHNDEIPLDVRIWIEDDTLHVHPATFRSVRMTRLAPGRFAGLGGEIEVILGDTPSAWTLRVRDLGDFTFRRQPTSEPCPASAP
jgi:CubicO group peptidase (beta-lactamase class C family)